MDLPYLTSDFDGVGGVIKQRPEDFFVQEIPLYEAGGKGEHVYCEIQKTGITTFDAINKIARALDVPTRNIGYAGLKDASAVTRQVISILGVAPEAVQNLAIPNIAVQWVDRHLNKIRLGHLAANRFAVKIRDVTPTDVVRLQPALDLIARRGMPNYFGEQRFGRRGDNHLLGAALIRQDFDELIQQLLGRPNHETDDAQQAGARKAFDQGDLERAMHLWPRHSGMERRVLHRLMKTGKARAAARAIDQRLTRLWTSALQSKLFNEVAALRVRDGTFDRLIEGDFAIKHENNAGFPVEDPAVEQPRCDAFEISPTGPLVGYRMTLPRSRALEIEEKVFAEAGLTPADFRKEGGERIKGTRRALRARPRDIEIAGGVDEYGPHITVAFTLPAGSFATVLLEELMKPQRHAGRGAAPIAPVSQEEAPQPDEQPAEQPEEDPEP